MKRYFRGHQGRQRSDKVKGTIVTGVIQHHGRFAFLLAEKENGADVFLHGRGLDLAMDGDKVSAKVHREADGRFSGEIINVLEHARKNIIGVLKKLPHGWIVVSEKGDVPATEVAGFGQKLTPTPGAIAVLQITRWPTERLGAAGRVTEILGQTGDVKTRITMLLRAHGISETFPKEVLNQSNALPGKLEPPDWRGREELFHLPIVTIDGADAKDFDDAVSLEPLDRDVIRLGVHIADVGHYVKTGSALDKEAYKRGTSVYLPDRVVPMLPPTLSNNLCSLVPFQERLTMSVLMDISAEGKVIKRRMSNSVIRSCRRFTYDEVQKLLDGGYVAEVPKAAKDAVLRMGKLAEVLYRQRVERGALDFNLPEYKVDVDANGKPIRVVQRPRLASHRLIEEFMLLANEAIATELMAAHAPFLHRRHDVPDPAKIQKLATELGELGLSAGHLQGRNTHKALQDILRQAQGHPLEDIINSLMVRSMQQAVYSPESLGHFGIAARAYAHFTSPIRRYPDLMAHRAIKALLQGKKENHGALSLAEAGVHCSERERAAAEVENKAVDLLRAELFKDQVGKVMDGIVVSVMERGSFIRCGDTGAEGFLRETNLKLGDKLKVMIDKVDPIEGKIDLSLGNRLQLPTHWRMSKLKSRHPGRNKKRH
ncbi:MAG: ribonuclease R [bacterium]|nr:ribonuclease R [bacterium]MDD5354300.1 ribonuclease R [bacterium]